MKAQIQSLSNAAAENIQKCAFNKAQSIINQLIKIGESLNKAAEQTAADYAAAKKGKKTAAKAAAKAAAEIAADTSRVITSLQNTLQLAKAAAADEKAKAAAVAAENQEKARAEKAAAKTAAKAVTAAAARGLNQYRNSYKGLLRDVANDIYQHGQKSVYLQQITFAVYGGLQTEKIKGEQSADYVIRAMKNGAALTAKIDITKTLLCSYLSAPQKMFKLFCDTLPAVEISRDAKTGKVITAFAKTKVIAYSSEKATTQIKEDTEKYQRLIINENLYYVLADYADIDFESELSENGQKVLSRRRINAEKAEQNKYYIQGENIVTLQPSDRINFTQLLPAVASVCSAGALKAYDAKQKAAAEKAAAKAAAEKSAAAKAAAKAAGEKAAAVVATA